MASLCPFSARQSQSERSLARDKTWKKNVLLQASLSLRILSTPCNHLPAAPQPESLRLMFCCSLHVSRIRPHRRRRWHYHQRPRLSCTSRTSTAVEGCRRISLTLSPLRLCKFEPHTCFPTAQRVPRYIPGSTTSRQHNENPEGARRDKDCTTQDH